MKENKKLREEIDSIMKKYPIGEKNFCSSRSKKYCYFFWWRIIFTPEVKKALKKEFQDYEGIHLMPYYIDSNLFDKVKHTDMDCPLPNLDKTSGNMHPCWGEKEVEEWCKNPSIKQVILVKRHGSNPWGPLKDSLNHIKVLTDIENIADLNCYYPSPKEEISETEPLETLLKGLLLQILDEKELNKDNLLYKKLYEENYQ